MDAVEDVRSRLNIEDVVGEYVELKRAGRNFKGLSPFTSEKTPSFIVSPEKQIWHDFSSGKGGSVYDFVMAMEGLDFRGALEHLARKAGVDLSQYRSGKSAGTGKLKERLYLALEAAAKFYQVQFSRNQTALEYVFKKRQYTKETALMFRLGYSPNTGTALMDYLKKQGFNDQEIKQAGLSAQRYRGPSDMFRGRLMVPLQDPQGRVIGFTARLLEDNPEAPKYINTPQTLLYDKSRHVFGLHLAKEAIRKNDYAVIVEGNLDVIASHQAGFQQVVATAGTALTPMQVQALNRFTGDIRLAFDQDRAGQAAAERSIPVASKVGVSLSIVTIPAGKDPDELIKQDPKLWEKALNQPANAVDWLIERYQQQLDLSTATGKRQFSDVVLNVVRQLGDSVEQDHYLDKIAGIIGVSKEALLSKFRQSPESKRSPKRQPPKPAELDKQLVEQTKSQNQLLCLALLRPKLRKYLEHLTPEMLAEENARLVLKFLTENPEFDGDAKVLEKFVKEKSQALQTSQSKGLQEGVAHGANEEAQQGVQRSTSREHRSSQHSDTPSTNRGASLMEAGQVVRVQTLEDYVKMLLLQHEAMYKDLDEVELAYEAAQLQGRLIKQFVKTQKHELAQAMQAADDKTTHQLLRQARALDQLLNQTKGE